MIMLKKQLVHKELGEFRQKSSLHDGVDMVELDDSGLLWRVTISLEVLKRLRKDVSVASECVELLLKLSRRHPFEPPRVFLPWVGVREEDGRFDYQGGVVLEEISVRKFRLDEWLPTFTVEEILNELVQTVLSTCSMSSVGVNTLGRGLSLDLLCRIFEYVSIQDIYRLSLTSKMMSKLCRNEELWNRLFFSQLPIPELITVCGGGISPIRKMDRFRRWRWTGSQTAFRRACELQRSLRTQWPASLSERDKVYLGKATKNCFDVAAKLWLLTHPETISRTHSLFLTYESGLMTNINSTGAVEHFSRFATEMLEGDIGRLRHLQEVVSDPLFGDSLLSAFGLEADRLRDLLTSDTTSAVDPLLDVSIQRVNITSLVHSFAAILGNHCRRERRGFTRLLDVYWSEGSSEEEEDDEGGRNTGNNNNDEFPLSRRLQRYRWRQFWRRRDLDDVNGNDDEHDDNNDNNDGTIRFGNIAAGFQNNNLNQQTLVGQTRIWNEERMNLLSFRTLRTIGSGEVRLVELFFNVLLPFLSRTYRSRELRLMTTLQLILAQNVNRFNLYKAVLNGHAGPWETMAVMDEMFRKMTTTFRSSLGSMKHLDIKDERGDWYAGTLSFPSASGDPVAQFDGYSRRWDERMRRADCFRKLNFHRAYTVPYESKIRYDVGKTTTSLDADDMNVQEEEEEEVGDEKEMGAPSKDSLVQYLLVRKNLSFPSRLSKEHAAKVHDALNAIHGEDDGQFAPNLLSVKLYSVGSPMITFAAPPSMPIKQLVEEYGRISGNPINRRRKGYGFYCSDLGGENQLSEIYLTKQLTSNVTMSPTIRQTLKNIKSKEDSVNRHIEKTFALYQYCLRTAKFCSGREDDSLLSGEEQPNSLFEPKRLPDLPGNFDWKSFCGPSNVCNETFDNPFQYRVQEITCTQDVQDSQRQHDAVPEHNKDKGIWSINLDATLEQYHQEILSSAKSNSLIGNSIPLICVVFTTNHNYL